MPKKYLVAGVGNILYGDDGAGIEVLKYLKPGLEQKEFKILEFSTQSIDLINYVKKYPVSFIIDAVDFKKPPGFVKAFGLEDVNANIRGNKVSSHGIKLSDFFNLYKALKIRNKIYIIGIQPKDMLFGAGLSREVLGSFPKILSEIKEVKRFLSRQARLNPSDLNGGPSGPCGCLNKRGKILSDFTG